VYNSQYGAHARHASQLSTASGVILTVTASNWQPHYPHTTLLTRAQSLVNNFNHKELESD